MHMKEMWYAGGVYNQYDQCVYLFLKAEWIKQIMRFKDPF